FARDVFGQPNQFFTMLQDERSGNAQLHPADQPGLRFDTPRNRHSIDFVQMHDVRGSWRRQCIAADIDVTDDARFGFRSYMGVKDANVGVTNIGVFDAHIRPKAKTRIICYVNVGSYALTTPRPADVMHLDEVDRVAIARCVEANPGLISGVKLRITGPFVLEHGEELIRLSKDIARE